jgi:hypothetical protein
MVPEDFQGFTPGGLKPGGGGGKYRRGGAGAGHLGGRGLHSGDTSKPRVPAKDRLFPPVIESKVSISTLFY